jgi:hypothetical protein
MDYSTLRPSGLATNAASRTIVRCRPRLLPAPATRQLPTQSGSRGLSKADAQLPKFTGGHAQHGRPFATQCYALVDRDMIAIAAPFCSDLSNVLQPRHLYSDSFLGVNKYKAGKPIANASVTARNDRADATPLFRCPACTKTVDSQGVKCLCVMVLARMHAKPIKAFFSDKATSVVGR